MPNKEIINISNDEMKYDKDYSYLPDNIYVKYGKDWDMIASKSEFIQYQEKIKKIRDEMYSLSLSPLERLMYAYDIVKSKTYNMSNDDSLNGLPHLTINGENIVCRGYCLLLNELLYGDKDIKICDVGFTVYNQEREIVDYHDRNIVVINDTKYNIQGAYFLDPTNDSYSKEKEVYFGTDYRETDLYICFLRKLTDPNLFHDEYEFNINQLDSNDNLSINPTYTENQETKLIELFTLYSKEDLSYILEETFGNIFGNMDIETIRNYILGESIDYKTVMEIAVNVRKAKGLSEMEIGQEYKRIARINAPFFDIAMGLSEEINIR